jgi:hypothetical protein
MKLLQAGAAVLLVAGLVTAFQVAGDDGYVPPMPKPGPEHELFKDEVGTWDAVVKSQMPGLPAQESRGVATMSLMSGGLWLLEDFVGSAAGSPFAGHGIYGWDPAKKKYVSTWVDNMTDHLQIGEGTYDGATKTMTMVVKTRDPAQGGKEITMTQKMVRKDRDHSTFTIAKPDASGKEAVVLTVEYTRRK